MKRVTKDGHEFRSIHPTELECRYLVGERDGKKILQLNSYGSDDRQVPDKLSQTLQFNEASAKDLYIILKKEFGF